MNCLDFHREKLADPRHLSEGARTHGQGCPNCAAFARGVDEGDAMIASALSVPVPEGLAERVLLRQQGAGRPAWRAWALAASVVAGILSAVVYLNNVPGDQYARLAIEHVLHEPESFTAVYHAEPESVDAALRSVGASIKAPFGQVRYVRLCPLEGGGTGWHIVFDTPQGLATLIIVPNASARSTTETTVNGWHALVQPFPRGYYVVVTSSSAATSQAGALLRQRVNWST